MEFHGNLGMICSRSSRSVLGKRSRIQNISTLTKAGFAAVILNDSHIISSTTFVGIPCAYGCCGTTTGIPVWD